MNFYEDSTKEEIEAYIALDLSEFDFGEGLIKNESSKSEYIYYKMALQSLEYADEYSITPKKSSKRINKKLRWKNKEIEKKKLEKMLRYNKIFTAYEVDGRIIRCYRPSDRSRFLKRKSNKKIRKYDNHISDGGFYRKIFDYWWEMY